MNDLSERLAKMMDDFWQDLCDEVRANIDEADRDYESIEYAMEDTIMGGAARDLFIAVFEEITENEVDEE